MQQSSKHHGCEASTCCLVSSFAFLFLASFFCLFLSLSLFLLSAFLLFSFLYFIFSPLFSQSSYHNLLITHKNYSLHCFSFSRSVDKSCVWECGVAFFGSTCVECAIFKQSEHLPDHAHWSRGQPTCTWTCDDGYPLSDDGASCIVTLPPGAPSEVVLSNPTSSTTKISWMPPTHDSRVPVSEFSVEITMTGALVSTRVVTIEEAAGPSDLYAPAGETGVWYQYFLNNLVASTSYTVQIKAKTVAGYGDLSPPSNAETTLLPTAPSSPVNLEYVSPPGGGSVTVRFHRPNDLGGAIVEDIRFVAECSEADGSSSNPTVVSSDVMVIVLDNPKKIFVGKIYGEFFVFFFYFLSNFSTSTFSSFLLLLLFFFLRFLYTSLENQNVRSCRSAGQQTVQHQASICQQIYWSYQHHLVNTHHWAHSTHRHCTHRHAETYS